MRRAANYTNQDTPRWKKILRISQAHLAPGMSLETWREILTRHNVLDRWDGVKEATLDAIIGEIGQIVLAAGLAPEEEYSGQ